MEKNKNQKFFFTIKNLLSISRNFDLKLFFNDQGINNNAKNLILSYSTKENFDLEGNFVDNYFNIKSKDQNFLATNIT